MGDEMSNKRIIYADQDEVRVVVPASTIEAALKDVPEGAAYEIVDSADIPAYRTFRNAWQKNGKQIETDINKAKTISHEFRRQERNKRFAPLDIEAVIPAKAAAAEKKRQKIRDADAILQADIDNAKTENELKGLHDAIPFRLPNGRWVL